VMSRSWRSGVSVAIGTFPNIAMVEAPDQPGASTINRLNYLQYCLYAPMQTSLFLRKPCVNSVV